MGKLWIIIKREYLERVRTRWFFIATIFGPVFFGSLIILPAYMAKRSKGSSEFVNIIILDATGTSVGQKIAAALDSGRPAGSVPPIVRVVPPAELSQAESTATHQVMNKQASGYVVLDAQTVKGDELRYAGRDATSLNDMERLRATVKEAILTDR